MPGHIIIQNVDLYLCIIMLFVITCVYLQFLYVCSTYIHMYIISYIICSYIANYTSPSVCIVRSLLSVWMSQVMALIVKLYPCVYRSLCWVWMSNESHCKVIPMCLQILVLGLSVPLALNVKYFNQLVKHSVSHHVILTMEDARMMKYAHWRMWHVSEHLAHQ